MSLAYVAIHGCLNKLSVASSCVPDLYIGGASVGLVLIVVLVIILIVLIRRRRVRVSDAENRQNKRGNDGRKTGRSGNQSSTHRPNYDQTRGNGAAGVATVPGRQEAGLGRRATQPVMHKQPRHLPSRQASLPVTHDPSQSAIFAPRGHGSDDAYQHLTPGAESTYQPLKGAGDGATYVQLTPDAKGATKEDKDNVYQELF